VVVVVIVDGQGINKNNNNERAASTDANPDSHPDFPVDASS